jgi:hypothetical protein
MLFFRHLVQKANSFSAVIYIDNFNAGRCNGSHTWQALCIAQGQQVLCVLDDPAIFAETGIILQQAATPLN